jgi:hypothetical protein
METRPYSPFLGHGDYFFGKVTRKTRFRKFAVGIYRTILKTAKSAFCTRKWFFAERQYNFRKVPDICELATADISSKAPSSTKSWRLRLAQAGAQKLSHCSLGRHKQIPDFT